MVHGRYCISKYYQILLMVYKAKFTSRQRGGHHLVAVFHRCHTFSLQFRRPAAGLLGGRVLLGLNRWKLHGFAYINHLVYYSRISSKMKYDELWIIVVGPWNMSDCGIATQLSATHSNEFCVCELAILWQTNSLQ